MLRKAKKTKYDSVHELPAHALPVSEYAKKFDIPSPAYVYTKYNRHKFGIKIGRKVVYRDHPGYDIVDFHGTAYVINYS